MKVIVEEFSLDRTNGYKVNRYDSNGFRLAAWSIYYVIKSAEVDEKIYYLLFDNEGNLHKNVYIYINDYLISYSKNTRYKNLLNLRYIFIFEKIIKKDLNTFTYQDFKLFLDFLMSTQKNMEYEFYVMHSKSRSTIYAIVSSIIKYMFTFNYRNIKNLKSALMTIKSYRINKSNFECPKFISVADFKRIIYTIENDGDICKEKQMQMLCIAKLMYNSGLRIGEVLGLTIEDFERIILEDGAIVYRVYIRNRVSDNKNQLAKTCMNVYKNEDYWVRPYKNFKVGYQIVNISEKLYEEIIDYYDFMSSKLAKKEKIPALADSVIKKNAINYYVFNNISKNTSLSVVIVRDYFRKIFNKVGLEIDVEKRSNNLLHRFRHGFIMRLLYIEKMDPYEVIQYSRHASTDSLLPYNNPTPDMIVRIYEDIEEFV